MMQRMVHKFYLQIETWQIIPEGKPIYRNGVWDINQMKSLEGQGQVEPFLNAEERQELMYIKGYKE